MKQQTPIGFERQMKMTRRARFLSDMAPIELGEEAVPDETTLCKFRHLLEEHNLGRPLPMAVNERLYTNKIKISRGTIVDATMISAPSSTKNKDGKPHLLHGRETRVWGDQGYQRRREVIKRVFGLQKVRYRGLARNLHRLEVTAALANSFIVRRRLLQAQAICCCRCRPPTTGATFTGAA